MSFIEHANAEHASAVPQEASKDQQSGSGSFEDNLISAFPPKKMEDSPEPRRSDKVFPDSFYQPPVPSSEKQVISEEHSGETYTNILREERQDKLRLNQLPGSFYLEQQPQEEEKNDQDAEEESASLPDRSVTSEQVASESHLQPDIENAKQPEMKLEAIDPSGFDSESEAQSEQIFLRAGQQVRLVKVHVKGMNDESVNKAAEFISGVLKTDLRVGDPIRLADGTVTGAVRGGRNRDGSDYIVIGDAIWKILPQELSGSEATDQSKTVLSEQAQPQGESATSELIRQEGKKFRVGIVDISSALEAAARDRALERLTQSIEDRPEVKNIKDIFTKKFAKHVFTMLWKGGIAREYYRQRDISQERKKILSDQDLFNDPKAMKEVVGSTVDRFVSEYEETIHAEAGERREKIASDIAVSQQIKSLMNSYLEGSVNETQFAEEKARIFGAVKNLKSTDDGLLFADNMLEVAKQMKELVSAGASARQLLEDFEVVVGAAKLGVRTEAQFNAVDRLTQKISNTKLGSLVGPETISGALALVYGASESVLSGSLRTAATSLLGFGGSALVSGALAGAKESFRITEERMQHMRDLAKGKEFEPDKMRRRAELQPTVYAAERVSDATAELSVLTQKIESGSWDKSDAEALIGKLASVNAKISISDRTQRDLLSYTDEKTIEEQRKQLDILRAQARVVLKRLSGEPAMVAVLNGKSVSEVLESQKNVITDSLFSLEIDTKDRLFRTLKAKRVGSALFKGVATGLVIGGISQEVRAFFDQNLQGAVETVARGNALQTGAQVQAPLESLRTWLTGELHVQAKLPDGLRMEKLTSGDFVLKDATGGVLAEKLQVDAHGKISESSRQLLESKGIRVTAIVEKVSKIVAPKMQDHLVDGPLGDVQVKVPEGMRVLSDIKGQAIRVLNDRGEAVLVLPLDKNGNPTQEAARLLERSGGSISSKVRQVIDESEITTSRTGNIAEFVKNNEELFQKVKRKLWFDNDTTGVFDKNELKLHWGGTRGAGLDSDGNIVMSMSRMEKDGSYHKGISADALQIAREGKMFLALSASKGTQQEVIKIPVDENGNFIIDKDSIVAKTFFDIQNGRVKFVGKFAEVAESLGEGEKGAENIRVYATAVGKGLEGKRFDILDTVKHAETTNIQDWNISYAPPMNQEPESIFKFIVDSTKKDSTLVLPTEWPPFLTLQLRTPLERLRLRKTEAQISNEESVDLESASGTSNAQPELGTKNENSDVSSSEKVLPSELRPSVPDNTPVLTEEEANELESIRKKMEYSRDTLVQSTVKQFENFGSEQLKENPDADLNHYQEIESYFSKQTPEYMTRVKNLASQAEVMGEKTKLSILIPVAGDQEGQNIYSTLENFTKQTADPSAFELVMFVNTRTKKFKDGKFVEVQPDNTLDEIQRFKEKYPNIQLRVMNERIKPVEANLGFIRKLLADATMYRHHARGSGAEDLIMVSNDADNKGLDPRYVAEFLRTFEQNPKMDAVKGLLDWDVNEFLKHPAVHIGVRLFGYETRASELGNKINNLSGANSAFRSSIFAAIGGYPEISQGEDVSIGWNIAHARGIQRFNQRGKLSSKERSELQQRWRTQQRLGFSRLSRIYTSARRAVHRYYEEGVYPADMWSNFAKNDEEIRKAEKDGRYRVAEPNYDSVEYVNSLKRELEEMINSYYRGADQRLVNNRLKYLGIRVREEQTSVPYESNGVSMIREEKKLRITDMSMLLKGLKEYQLYGSALADVKTGKAKNIEGLLRADLSMMADFGVDELRDELETFSNEEEQRVDPNGLVQRTLLSKLTKNFNPDVVRRVGEYELFDNTNMSQDSEKKVVYAQKIDTSDIYVVKETSEALLQDLADRKRYPLRADSDPKKGQRVVSIEEYLQDKVNPDLVVSPLEFSSEGGIYRRIYKNAGISMDEYLRQKDLNLPEILSLTIRGLQALGELHKNNVVHTDYNLSNLLLDVDGKVRLADLESGFYDKDGLGMISRGDMTWGYPGILAPEMHEAGAFFNRSVDTYAVGATLYYMLTQTYPMTRRKEELRALSPEDREKFFSENLKGLSFPENTDPKLKDVILKALDPKPSQRYQGTAEMMKALLEVYRSTVFG